MEHLYVIGIDYGTDSVRALLADAESGEEIAVAVCNYSRWGRGLYCDTAKSQFRQHPLDYLEGLEQVLRQVIAQCPAPEAIRAIAVDTTASTPCLVDRTCTPLSLTAGYEENPDAMFVLWKDHTAQRESEEITALCAAAKSITPAVRATTIRRSVSGRRSCTCCGVPNGCAAMRGPSSSCATGFRPC